MSTAFVILDETGLAALPWAAHVASAFGGPLLVLHPPGSGAYRVTQVTPGSEAPPPLLARTLEAAPGAGAGDAQVYACGGARIRRAILDAALDLGVRRLVLHAALREGRDQIDPRLRQIARAAPYDIMVVDVGRVTDRLPRRVIVPQFDGGGEFAARAAVRVCAEKGIPIVLVADPAARRRSQKVLERVRDALPSQRRELLVQRHADEPPDVAIGEALSPDDLVLYDAEDGKRVVRLLSALRELRRERPGVPFAVGLTRGAHAAGPGHLERAVERWRLTAPRLSREERKDLYARLDAGGRVSTDFVVMLTLSAAIASLGLIQSSAAVVIGAMLVAPLMTPLVAIGMALAQGNAVMFREARRAMAIGISGALIVSVLIGLLVPWGDLSGEVAARGAPNVFDLGIALLSGVAAAYALARPGLAGTLVGVAIAVALVPPLASIGIALAQGEFAVMTGAAVLFATNLFAITLGAAAVFRLFGVRAVRGDGAIPRWVLVVSGALMVGAIVTLIPLTQNLQAQAQRGVDRPYSRPLPAALRNEIEARVAEEGDVEIVFMAHSNIEDGFGVEVALLCTRAVDPALREDILALIRAEMGDDLRARVLLLSGGAELRGGAGAP